MPNDKGTGKLLPAHFAVVVGDSGLVAAAPVACHLVLEVQSISAYRVRRFIDADIEAGWITAPWDGRNDAGDVCSNGLYLAHARFNTWDLYTVFELKGRR